MIRVGRASIFFTSYSTNTTMTFPNALENLNILAQRTLPPPSQLHLDIAASAAATHNVNTARAALTEILSGRDKRLIVVVGPCSIHDPKAVPGRHDCLERHWRTHHREPDPPRNGQRPVQPSGL